MEAATLIEARFFGAFERGRGGESAEQLLAFEQLLEDWKGDTDHHHRQLARAGFRRLIERLGKASEVGLRKPEELFSPWVESLLAVRAVARRDRLYAVADVVREELVRHGVEVRDNADGSSTWVLRPTTRALVGRTADY